MKRSQSLLRLARVEDRKPVFQGSSRAPAHSATTYGLVVGVSNAGNVAANAANPGRANYSMRSARTGSTPAARRAGMKLASAATRSSTPATRTKITGSRGDSSKSSGSIQWLNPSATTTPRPTPAAAELDSTARHHMTDDVTFIVALRAATLFAEPCRSRWLTLKAITL